MVQPVASLQDLLEQAAKATRDDVRSLLVRAEAIADHAYEWQGIADAWASRGEAAAAERCLTKALQRPDCGIWDHRRAAATRAKLGDGAGAVAT